MKKADVVEFFGGPYATAKALGISGQAVSKWEEDVPQSRKSHVELVMKMEAKRRDLAAKRAAKREARKAEKES